MSKDNFNYSYKRQFEKNSGSVLSEQRRSCRLCDILARAMRGAPLDITIDDSLEGASPQELEDWYVEPQFDDLNDAFEAGENVAANSEPIFERTYDGDAGSAKRSQSKQEVISGEDGTNE